VVLVAEGGGKEGVDDVCGGRGREGVDERVETLLGRTNVRRYSVLNSENRVKKIQHQQSMRQNHQAPNHPSSNPLRAPQSRPTPTQARLKLQRTRLNLPKKTTDPLGVPERGP
jgi:hypothetical protein